MRIKKYFFGHTFLSRALLYTLKLYPEILFQPVVQVSYPQGLEMNVGTRLVLDLTLLPTSIYEPRNEISNNVVCATSKASDQPAHTGSLIRAFTSRLNILSLLSY